MNPSDFDLENGTLLGCGAIAFVNRCKHIQSQNHFAVKTVSKIQALQQNKTDGLKAEKAILKKFSYHPGVAHLFGTTQSLDEIYFVMENLSRGDLMEHIKRISGLRRLKGENGGYCLQKKDVQKIIIQVVLTLKHLWENNIVHRDVKPENIAFHSNGRAVLIDFDTVLVDAPPLKPVMMVNTGEKDKPPSGNDETTAPPTDKKKKESIKISEIQSIRRKSQAFCGTAQFVSPETLNSCDWTFSSDLFGLGSVIYFMLAGRPLFDGPNTFSVLAKIRDGAERIPLNQWSDGVKNCDGAMNLIRLLLSADPRERFCKFNEEKKVFEFDLQRFKSHPFFSDAQDLWDQFLSEDEIINSKEFQDETQKYTVQDLLSKPSLTPCNRLLTRQKGESAATAVSYTDEPKHDDEYSQYALKSSTSDLERWWKDAIEGVQERTMQKKEDENDDDEEKETGTKYKNENEVVGKKADAASSSEDDEMNVIDDVGQREFVTSNAFGDKKEE